MSRQPLDRGDLSGLPETGLAVVGFSGGADSTALAHWLSGRIGRERILLAHVNHMLRGEEAERDEAAAREFARRLGLRFLVSRVDVRAMAKEKGLGLEECGRMARYGFFASLAPGENDRILTAHTADDNAETLLLNLCRGAGLTGLCGIPPRRGKILRPLLRVSRKEIEEYCGAHGLSYVEDSTNASREFARNRVRLDIMPALRELNPQALGAISQTAELLSRDRDFIQKEAQRLLERAKRTYGLDAAELLEAPEALRCAALRLWLEETCGGLEKKHLDALEFCLAEGGAVSLPGGVTVRKAQGVLSAAPQRAAAPFSLPLELPAVLADGIGKVPLPGGKVLILEKKEGPFKKCGQKIHNLYFKTALDYDIITGNLIVRTRRAGDRFSPAGREGSKSLKQLFQECGMPAALRGGAVLLECGGRLAWCQGVGASREFQVTGQTRRALLVAVEEQEEK